MKRRLLSAFLAVMMVLTMAPVAFAADGVEPTDGTGSSEAAPAKTLQKQIDEAENGATITLNDNYTEDITIPADKVITLNLNDKKLTNVQSDTITVTKGAKLTIEGAGTVDNVTHAKSALVNYGEVVLNNGVTLERSSEKGTLSPYSPGGNSCYTILNDKGATMTINDATVKNNGGFSSAIRNGGDENCNDASNLTINDGNFSGGINSVKNDECGILTINGGTFSNTSQYVIMNWNKATINNGTFSVKDSADAVLFTAAYRANRAVGELIVNNGTFTGNGSQKMVENHYGSSYTGTASITGGTFSSDVSAYCDANYATEKNTDNTYTVKPLKDVAVAKIGDTYYKTLADAVAAAKDGDTVTLLKNVVLNSTLTLNKNMTLDLNGCEISNGSTMGTNYLVSIAANANVSIVGDKANSKISDSRSNAQGTITAVVVYGKLTVEGDNLTISRGANGIAVKVEDNPGTLTVNGGTITVDKPTQTSSQAIQNWGNATISGGVFNGDVDSYAYIAANKNYVGNMTIENGTFDGEVFAAQYTNDGVTWPTKSAKVSIVGGNFKGNIAEYYHNGNNGPQPVEKVNKPDNAAESEVTVSDGYFTVDPSAYCVTGKTGVTSDKDGYQYKVGTIEVKDENEIKTDTQKGTTQATLSGEIAADKRPATQAVGKSVTPTALTDTTPITADDKAQALTELVKNKKVKLTDDGKIPAGTTVTVVKETYLDVTVTAYDATSNTVSMDIVPKYNLIAVAKTGTDEKTVTLKSAQDAKVGSTEVKVTLPDAFKGKKVYINHNNGANLYVATANATTGEITFTTNGFSPFTFALSNPNVVAEVNGNAYTSFQDAVNAVANGGTIEIVGGNKNYTATISGSSKTFTVKNTLDSDITVKVNNDSKTVGKNNGTQSFTYTKPSSGGSSGGSSSGKTTYKVTTSAVNNGGVNASPFSAEKGAAITITLSPDKGYKLDKLTVTDGSGKTVSTVKKSDTVYTFTMPASAVKVGVSYVKATETPSETKFNDVSANDWFASAVDYVTGKGMMNGTADNTFSPKANTTRGMVVTVLYRLENQPSTSAASFTDVASGAYYANAVAWANANGIVSGYGSGKFGPNDKVTREQLAAILYRYAQYKKYDVSVGEDTNILSYNDAQSISTYAIPAIQWACGAGVVTGKSGSKLDPKGNATRAEVAAMLMRFCENVK